MMLENKLKHRFFENFLKYRFLLVELVKKDIKIKYRRSVLGIFWSFMEPLLFMIVLTIIFSTIFKNSIENYPVYLLTGRLVFTFFSSGTTAAMHSIYGNASTIKKLYVPKYIFTLGIALSNMVTFLLSLIILVAVMLVTGAPFTPFILTFLVPMLLMFVFTVGVGLILASVTVFFRDIEHLYGVFTTLLLYGSAIFFPPEIIPQPFQILLYFNPVFVYIDMFRDAFLYATWFDPFQIIYGTACAVGALFLGR